MYIYTIYIYIYIYTYMTRELAKSSVEVLLVCVIDHGCVFSFKELASVCCLHHQH